MFHEKRSNLIGHGKQRGPLLLIERHGKATEAIDRHASLLADLEADGAITVALQALIFCFEAASSSVVRLSSTMGGSYLQVIARGRAPGRLGAWAPGRLGPA